MRVDKLLEQLKIEHISKGADYLVHCLNPEHTDINPSMRIDKVTGVYGCFGCGHKGNILTDYGYNPSIVDAIIVKLKKKISRLLVGGLSVPEGAMAFKHEHRGISPETYQTFGAFTHETYEGRIVFPITSREGNIVAFLGRYTHSDASPKYKVFPKGTPLPLYPPKPDLHKGSIILVEGLFDMLNLYEHGVKNVVATFGTSTIYKKIEESLTPYELLGVNKIYIMFDGDKAGHVASKKIKHLIPERFSPERIELPDDMDPGMLDKGQVDYLMKGIYG
ncbi:MAG: toprim domain-containing protein [Aureispira sp.]|nr:toprim domain-containing protein [Aureispira sp.]